MDKVFLNNFVRKSDVLKAWSLFPKQVIKLNFVSATMFINLKLDLK